MCCGVNRVTRFVIGRSKAVLMGHELMRPSGFERASTKGSSVEPLPLSVVGYPEGFFTDRSSGIGRLFPDCLSASHCFQPLVL